MDYIGIITGVLGITTAILGALAWYRGAIEQQYASQRDFGHLKRNYEQLSAHLSTLIDEEDERYNEIRLELREIKFLLGQPHDSGPHSGINRKK